MQLPPIRYTSSAGGLSIAYRVLGDGPTILGLGDWWGHVERDWDLAPLARFWTRLSSFARLIQYDIRGTSMSDPLPHEVEPALEDCVEDAIAVLDATATTTATLFAAGAATPLALRIAQDHPDRLSGLVIYNGFGRFTSGPSQAFGLDPSVIDSFKDTVLQSWGADDVILMANPSLADQPDIAEVAAKNVIFTATPSVARVLLPLLYQSDSTAGVTTLETPTLVLHSPRNQLLTPDHAHALAESVPDARLVELPGRDLNFWGEDADLIVDEIQEFVTGSRDHSMQARVVRTIVFTDIVDSTATASRLGDERWGQIVHELAPSMRATVSRSRGRYVKSTGDGILCTFDTPSAALMCATKMHHVAEELGLKLRVGIHTGEINLAEDDLTGIAAHIAARVQAEAVPGETLVTRTVVDLVTGSGVRFDDRGELELRGVPGTWAVFAIDADGD